MKKKDPYLSELEGMNDLEDSTDRGPVGDDDLTKLDLKAPVSEETELAQPVKPPSKQPPKQILDLAPDVPVSFVAVIGRKEITVGDLMTLKSGEVIELNRLPSDGVDLVVGGRVIGKGELVDVEGRLGVRILKLLK